MVPMYAIRVKEMDVRKYWARVVLVETDSEETR